MTQKFVISKIVGHHTFHSELLSCLSQEQVSGISAIRQKKASFLLKKYKWVAICPSLSLKLYLRNVFLQCADGVVKINRNAALGVMLMFSGISKQL